MVMTMKRETLTKQQPRMLEHKQLAQNVYKTGSPSKQMWCPKELRQYERNTALSQVIFYCHAIEVKCNSWLFKLLIHVQCAYCDIINLQNPQSLLQTGIRCRI